MAEALPPRTMADLLEDGNPWKFHPEKDLRLRHGKPYLYETNDQKNAFSLIFSLVEEVTIQSKSH